VIAGTWRRSRSPVEAPLVDRVRRPRELRGPAELALDIAEEVVDLVGGSLGLHAQDAHLQSPHRIARLPVRGERRETRSNGRHAAEERDELASPDADRHATLRLRVMPLRRRPG
jgi:hypothetical protein